MTDYDWSEIVFDLKRAGMSHKDICAALKGYFSEATIRHYMAGWIIPTHWRGEQLLDLWCARMDRDREDAPRTAVRLRHSAGRRGKAATA